MTYFKNQFIAQSNEQAASEAFNTETLNRFISCSAVDRNVSLDLSDDLADYIEQDYLDASTDAVFDSLEQACDVALEHYETDPLDILISLEDYSEEY